MRTLQWVRAMLAGLALVGGCAAAQDVVVRQLARWIIDAGDHGGAPFAIVDKRGATLNVFDGNGRLQGASPALLGITPGDGSEPGVAQRVQTGLSLQDRTTPAGRFVTEPGRNLKGERVVWVDYASAFAIHRMRPANERERREERLASAAPDDNRITLGCVVVPVSFYENVVDPLIGRRHAVVYVLPESGEISGLLAAH